MISSLSNAVVRHIALLQSKEKARREEGLYIIEGARMYMEAPLSRIEGVYVTEDFLGNADYKMSDVLSKTGYEVVSDEVMKKMSDTQTPQGILCIVRAPSYELDGILDAGSLFVILDSLKDPGNLGTIFRTAEAAGASGIIMSRDTVSIFNPKSVRSTMGTLFRMPFVYTDPLTDAISSMKKRGISVFAASLSGQRTYTECDLSSPCAIVIGNEGAGISPEVMGSSDICVLIPMEGQVESLNAAVSAAVLLFEAHRQKA